MTTERVSKSDVNGQVERIEKITGRHVVRQTQHPGDGVRISAWLQWEEGKPQVSVCAATSYRDAYNQLLAFVRGYEAAQRT